MNHRALFFFTMAVSFALPVAALAQSTTVNGTDVIYSAGSSTLSASSVGGTTPAGIISVSGDSYVTFSVSGQVMLNIGSGNNYNDPDGVGAAPASSTNTGYNSISGIDAPNAGYLVGVFLASGGPSGSAPTTLDYLAGGNASTSSSSYTPALDQVFFIGDGLTGDGTGSTQDFYVPAGASELVLGISDSCNYNGGPSCYNDNQGTFTVDYSTVGGVAPPPSSTPEPSSLALLATGLLAGASCVRRRFQLR